MYRLISSIFLGWSSGSNDSANIFGTAVASRTIKYKTAIIITSIFIIIGAVLEGQNGINTLGNLTSQTVKTAFCASISAAITVTLMTVIKLPVSTSQAAVGAIIGIALNIGKTDLTGLFKIIICWIGTPIGTIILSMILYPVCGILLERLPINIFTRGYIIKVGLIIAGCYGAYALGANNVANITGVYVKTGLIGEFHGTLIGALSIAAGVLTYSKKVMITVGKKLVKLDPYSSFITVLSEAIIVHIYAKIGVPVSSSQAIVGAVLGIGLLKGVQTIHFRVLFNIIFGWVGTPFIAALIAYLLYRIAG